MHAGQDRNTRVAAQVAVLLPDRDGCGDELLIDLPHRCGAGLHRRATGVVQCPDALDGGVLGRCDPVGPHGRSCSLVGVDRVGLTQPASFSPFGAHHLNNDEAFLDRDAGEAGAVGGCAFNPNRDRLAVADDRRQSPAVTGWRSRELTVVKVVTFAVDHSDVQRFREKYPRLFPDDADDWLAEVLGVAEERNELLHAVARNRCVTCGTATLFEHPRTGKLIERSEGAVQALTDRLLDLRERGGEIAAQIASLVSKQIILGAMLFDDDTGKTIVPETVHPNVVKHTCGDCNDDGRATAEVTIQLGNVEIKPTRHTKALLEDIRNRKG